MEQRGRPFKVGNNAGRGRPKGSRNKHTLMAELLNDYAEALIKKCIFQALQGDRSAMRLCIERLAAVPRDRCVEIDLPPANSAADIKTGLETIITHAAEGRISPAEAETLGNVLDLQRKAIETSEFDERLRKVEESSKEPRGEFSTSSNS